MIHDELVEALKLEYPGTTHGVEYLVAHPINPDGTPAGDANIVVWKLPGDPPDVKALWAKHGDQAALNWLAEATRRDRYQKLLEADQLVEKAIDVGDSSLEVKYRRYRQALRDVTKDPGWPDTFKWPEKP